MGSPPFGRISSVSAAGGASPAAADDLDNQKLSRSQSVVTDSYEETESTSTRDAPQRFRRAGGALGSEPPAADARRSPSKREHRPKLNESEAQLAGRRQNWSRKPKLTAEMEAELAAQKSG